jgi:ArsR family transcriptional regulator
MDILEIYKALSDINRIKIINILLEKELCVCEVEAVLDMNQSNVSRHLNKLKYANMVKARKESQWVYYSIDDKFLQDYPHLIKHLKNAFNKNEDLVNDIETLRELTKDGSICT